VFDGLAAVDEQPAGLPPHNAGGATGRAGLLRAEDVGLLFQEGGEGTFGKSSSGGSGDLFQGGEVTVEAWSLVAEGPTGNNLAPVGGQFADVLEVLGGEMFPCHELSCLWVAENEKSAYPSCCMAKAAAVQSRS
jgi:hypothetical protein